MEATVNRVVERQRFKCRDDDGNEHTVIEYQELIDTSSDDGPGSIEGMRSLVDSRGHDITPIDDNTFQILLTGQILRKV